jgi:hypothetical protein
MHQRHVVLFSSSTLADAVESLAAQPEPDAHLVFASDGGLSRELTDDERDELAGLTRLHLPREKDGP